MSINTWCTVQKENTWTSSLVSILSRVFLRLVFFFLFVPFCSTASICTAGLGTWLVTMVKQSTRWRLNMFVYFEKWQSDACTICVHLKGPILYCFSSISKSCQRSNNTVFEMHCPIPIRGPEFQLCKSHSTELYEKQAVSVPAPLNANELHLSTPSSIERNV